jgi:hypothetical protein
VGDQQRADHALVRHPALARSRWLFHGLPLILLVAEARVLPIFPSCPRLSRASTSSFGQTTQKDVDGRVKPGHDETKTCAKAPALALSVAGRFNGAKGLSQ